MHRSRLVAALFVVLAACAPSPSSPSASVAPGESGAPPVSLAPAPAFATERDRLQEHLVALQSIADENAGVRFAGSAGYEASVDYAAGVLTELGFSVETPQVEFTGFRELPGGELIVGGERFAAPDDLHALIYSPGGEISGRVAILDGSGCDPADFADLVPGEIAVTLGGGCFRRQQAINAAAAGATALVVGYPDRGPGEIFRPTLIEPDGIEIPVVSVTGEAVTALESVGDEPVELRIQTEREPATLRNVVAQLGDGPEVLMLGGHLDSVFEGPGINDNGSGVAALLEIARGVVAGGVPSGTAVRIALWGGEELGSIGSRAYVEGMTDEPIAYINLDMTGSLNGANLVYAEAGSPPGSDEITAAFEAWFDDQGEESARVDIGGSSDHFAFIQAGIPTGGLFAGATEKGGAAQPSASAEGRGPADACYHLACDTPENVDLDRIALFADASYAVAYALLAKR